MAGCKLESKVPKTKGDITSFGRAASNLPVLIICLSALTACYSIIKPLLQKLTQRSHCPFDTLVAAEKALCAADVVDMLSHNGENHLLSPQRNKHRSVLSNKSRSNHFLLIFVQETVQGITIHYTLSHNKVVLHKEPFTLFQHSITCSCVETENKVKEEEEEAGVHSCSYHKISLVLSPNLNFSTHLWMNTQKPV